MKNRTDKTARMATQLDPNPTQAKQERCRRKLRTRVTTLVAAAILASTELSFAEPVSLDLAPPMKGAVWAEDAARIELVSDDGTARTFTVTDFPVTIEAGSYTVMVDGISYRTHNIDKGTVLDISAWHAPRHTWLNDTGAVIVGRTIPLRALDTLERRLQGLNPKAFATYAEFNAIARPGLSEPQRTAAVKAALENLDRLIDRSIRERAAGEHSSASLAEQAVKMYAELLAEFGDLEIAETLLNPRYLTNFDVVLAAVEIERRRGKLNDGLAIARLKDNIETDLKSVSSLAVSLAKAGHALGFQTVAELNISANKKRRAENRFPTERFLGTLWLGPPDISLPVFRSYLEDAQRVIRNGIRSGDLTFLKSLNWSYETIEKAINLLAVHGSSDDRALLAIPIFQGGRYHPMSTIAADPGQLLQNFMNLDPGEAKNTFPRHSKLLRTFLCRALELRSSEDAAAINATAAAAVVQAYSNYTGESAAKETVAYKGLFREAVNIARNQRANCEADFDVNRMDFEWSEPEEEKAIQDSNRDYYWWYRPSFVSQQTAKFSDGKSSFLRLHGLSPYDHDWLMSTFGEGVDKDFLKAFELRHRLLTDAWNPIAAPEVSFGAERRSFRLRFDGDYGPVPLLGHVDVLPIIDGENLMIAVRTAATYDLKSTPIIGTIHAQFVDPYAKNHFRRMFKSVRLEQPGTVSEAEFLRTTQSGAHLFSVPFNGNFANSYLRVGLAFSDGNREHHWELDFALHKGVLDFKNRLSQTIGSL